MRHISYRLVVLSSILNHEVLVRGLCEGKLSSSGKFFFLSFVIIPFNDIPECTKKTSEVLREPFDCPSMVPFSSVYVCLLLHRLTIRRKNQTFRKNEFSLFLFCFFRRLLQWSLIPWDSYVKRFMEVFMTVLIKLELIKSSAFVNIFN